MAAVASRSTNNSPHLNSRMSSPKEPKRTIAVKNEDIGRRESPLQQSHDARHLSPPRSEPAPAASAPEAPAASTVESKSGSNAAASSNAQALAPPPRPSQNAPEPDYFSANHNNNNSLQREPNPFEQSFGNPSADTPGILPPVASLTSPSSLLQGGTPGWGQSLRSGPLSPAMLTGPTGSNDYFGDSHFRGGFPTPNESSLRTGLTPGGGGSMFPAPSPNSQALFNSLQSAGATPGTLDFHRTAMNAAAASNFNRNNNTSNPTSQPQEQTTTTAMDQKPFQPTAQPQQQQQDAFVHDGNDAANGLLYLSQASNGRPVNNGFAVPGQPSHMQTNMGQMGNMGSQSQETSPMSRRGPKNSVTSVTGSADTGDFSESHSEDQKPSRAKGKKGGSASKSVANNRRKAEETLTKGPANKKAKANNGNSIGSMNDDDDDDDMDDMDDNKDGMEDNKKMTDEEKRKNFLERNRVAALKCRQRKKQWLANLQAKVELFSTENDALSATVTQLREEIVNLKTLLLAHKECPVSQAQGISGMAMNQFIGEVQQHTNPYGMAMQGPNGVPQGMPMGMPHQQGQLQRT